MTPSRSNCRHVDFLRWVLKRSRSSSSILFERSCRARQSLSILDVKKARARMAEMFVCTDTAKKGTAKDIAQGAWPKRHCCRKAKQYRGKVIFGKKIPHRVSTTKMVIVVMIESVIVGTPRKANSSRKTNVKCEWIVPSSAHKRRIDRQALNENKTQRKGVRWRESNGCNCEYCTSSTQGHVREALASWNVQKLPHEGRGTLCKWDNPKCP